MSTRFIQGTPVNYQGRTDGAAVPAGQIGETRTAVPGSPVTVASSGVGTNVAFVDLTTGIWMVYGHILVTASAVTGGTWTQAGLTINTDGTNDANAIAAQIPLTANTASNLTVVSPPRYIEVTTSTQRIFLIGTVAYATYTGTYATSSRIRAIRIA